MSLINTNIVSSFFTNCISPIIGVVISAIIAWLTYKQQALENEVKETFLQFTYMFSLFSKNFEELYNVKFQITEPALKELENFLHCLDEVEEYLKWVVDNAPSPIAIKIPENNIRSYANKQIKKLSEKMILKVSTMQYYVNIDSRDITKEATLLSKYGNLYFISLYNRINNYCNMIKHIQEDIKLYNEENVEKPRSLYTDIKIKTDDMNYWQDINKQRGQVLYRSSLFKSYDKMVSRCLVLTYYAICHLDSFIQKYQEKYGVIQRALNIPYKSIKINKDSLLKENELNDLKKYISESELPLLEIPEYKNFKKLVVID